MSNLNAETDRSDGVDLIRKYFQLTANQQDQFEQLGQELKSWNEQINLISRKDIDHLFTRHILHSLGIASLIRFIPGTKVLDVGTGGGFPGLPLAILHPESSFHLVDSIGKKIRVVNGLTQKLGLNNVETSQMRAEQLSDSYDFIVSRAVTRISKFYSWVNKRVSKNSLNTLQNGILYLKGGDISDEMNALNRKYTLYNLKEHFEEDFFATKLLIHIPITR